MRSRPNPHKYPKDLSACRCSSLLTGRRRLRAVISGPTVLIVDVQSAIQDRKSRPYYLVRGDAGPSAIIHDDDIDSIRVDIHCVCVNIIVPVTLYESDHVPSRLGI